MKYIKTFKTHSIHDLIIKYKEIGKHHREFVQKYPSEDFAKQFGMPDLYTEWKLPYGLNNQELADVYLFARDHKDNDTCEKIKKELIRLNPELKILSHAKNVYLITGVISKYNLDDILYFINTDKDEQDKNFKTQVLYFGILNVNPYRGWVASKKTLNKISKKFDFDD